jgi:hypothetical protein
MPAWPEALLPGPRGVFRGNQAIMKDQGSTYQRDYLGRRETFDGAATSSES